MPDVVGDGSCGVGPHIHESRPTEKLNKTDRPENFRSVAQQGYEIIFLCQFFVRNLVKLPELRRWHFLYPYRRIEGAQYQYGCPSVERENYRIGDNSGGCDISDSDIGEQDRKQVAD